MRIRTLIALALVFSAVPLTVRADTWDYTYGDDPTNAENVSSFTDVRIDPIGGAWMIGYFAGQFEGLSSLGRLSRFIQHRSPVGTIDLTLRLEPVGITYNSIPAPVTGFVVDGQGVAYVRLDAGLTGQSIVSVDRAGALSRYPAGVAGGSISDSRACSSHSAMAASPKQGLFRLCSFNDGQSSRLELLDKSFGIVWQQDVSQYTGDIDGPASAINSIAVTTDDTVWLSSDLNADNFGSDQTMLPTPLRSALGLTRFDGRTGAKIVSIKHYGYLNSLCAETSCSRYVPQQVGSRQVWIRVRHRADGDRTLVIDTVDGSIIGVVPTNSAPAWSQTDQLMKRFNIGESDASPIRNLLTGGSWSAVGVVTNLAASGGRMVSYLRNDGRRLVVVKSGVTTSLIYVVTLSGDGVPQPRDLVSVVQISGNVKDADVDDQGNVLVVGSTFQQLVLPTEYRGAQASVNERAFITRNPAGRIGLTVLPRTPLKVKVTGANGVPSSGVGAVSLNLTVTSPSGDGYVTVFPCGSRPDASNLNFTADQTVPNAVITPISANGEVCFYSYAETHLLADVNGYFPTGAGFVSTNPVRVFDTRAASGQGLRTVNKVPVGGSTEVRVKLTDLPGYVPGSGVGAVSLNVTAVSPLQSGYVTVYPCGTRPEASNLNFAVGKTVPNAVIAPVSAQGEVCFYAYGLTDLIADLNGYFPSGAGFVATSPVRVADTRAASAQGLRTVTKQKIGDTTELRVKLTDLSGYVPSTGVGAVSLNVTVDGVVMPANSTGYLTVYPCGIRPNTSSLNFVNKQTVPNAVIAPVSAQGEVCFYAFGTTDVIVDLNGYFPTGSGFVPLAPARLFDTR